MCPVLTVLYMQYYPPGGLAPLILILYVTLQTKECKNATLSTYECKWLVQKSSDFVYTHWENTSEYLDSTTISPVTNKDDTVFINANLFRAFESSSRIPKTTE